MNVTGKQAPEKQLEEERQRIVSESNRTLSGPFRYVFSAIAIGFCILYILHIRGVFDSQAFFISVFQFLYLAVALAVIYTLVYTPATKKSPKHKPAWYDYILIAAVVPVTVFLWINWYDLKFAIYALSPYEIGICLLSLPSFLEAARRRIGWILPAIGMIFVLYVFVSPYLPGILQSRPRSLASVVAALYVGADGIYGSIMHLVVFTISIIFIFGAFLKICGGEKFFTDLAFGIAGRARGGAAKAAVISSGFFGMLSGSGVANVAVTGAMTIPMMKRSGFSSHFAGAVEAVASTGGTFMPPVMGAIAFIMADFLGLSYWQVVVHAFLPAFLFFFIAYVQVHLESLRYNIAPYNFTYDWSPKSILRNCWTVVVPLAVLIYYLGVARYTVSTSFLYALISLFVVSFFVSKDSRATPRKIISALDSGGHTILTFLPLIVVVGLILASVNMTGLGFRMGHFLAILGADNVFLMLMLGAASAVILGMAVSGIAVYIMLAIFIAPSIVAVLDIEPIAVHLFLMYISTTSMITPPVCLAVYVASSISQSNIWPTGFTAMRLGVGMYILPFAFIVNQRLLLIGEPALILVAVVSSIFACVLVAAGITGQFFPVRLNIPVRIMQILGGVALLYPSFVVKGMAAAFLLVSFIWTYILWRRQKGTPVV